MRKMRVVAGIVILIASIALLLWGLWPAAHQRHVLTVSPAEMTLPTPSSFVPSSPSGV
ncbi:MAG TPA: hypothetical protein VMJ64_04815 [Anaerolineales bacterium]|nr:hypothetical protein [Anaerolineales bacterium]